MEFSFDVSQTPLIGRRLLLKPDLETNISTQAKISNIGGTSSPRRSTSLSPADTAPLSGWKRPWMSQSRVRECLVNLLTACGQRVGLPKSPSVSLSENIKLFGCFFNYAEGNDKNFHLNNFYPFICKHHLQK